MVRRKKYKCIYALFGPNKSIYIGASNKGLTKSDYARY